MLTLVALAEGFGPGWTAKEGAQLGLQVLRNHFVDAKSNDVHKIIGDALKAVNQALYDRAVAYDAEGEIGCWLTLVVVVGNRCLMARVGNGAAYLARRDGTLQRLAPARIKAGDFLGAAEAVFALERVAADAAIDEDQTAHSEGGWVRLAAGDQLVLLNAAMDEALAGARLEAILGRQRGERAADRLIRLAEEREPELLLALLLVEIPGSVQQAAAVMGPLGRNVATGAVVLLILAGVLWGGSRWLGGSSAATPTLTAAPTPSPTIFLPPPATELPLLPTPFRTATASPTATATASPTATPSSTATVVPDTATPTATETPTFTPEPPTPTKTPTHTATVPVGPIRIGGQVVIVGTEGLGASLRDGPGMSYNRLFIVFDGERLTVVGGPEGDEELVWWQLQAADGQQGWAVDRFLQGVAE